MSQHFSSVTDQRVADLIRSGSIAVIPTDTVYGIVARAADEAAVARLYALKPRENQPGTLIASSINDLAALGLSLATLQRVEHYWPASLSVIIDAAAVPEYLKKTRTGLAVRIPEDPNLRALLAQTGPLMTSSANPPTLPTATTTDEAEAYFGESVPLYVDGGEIRDRLASTIVGFGPDGALTVVIRQGAVKL
jgi:tRNA threonylcarbamoyl adenosine modification protein (Sua5/YciO/YrdC/YwlC family)